MKGLLLFSSFYSVTVANLSFCLKWNTSFTGYRGCNGHKTQRSHYPETLFGDIPEKIGHSGSLKSVSVLSGLPMNGQTKVLS